MHNAWTFVITDQGLREGLSYFWLIQWLVTLGDILRFVGNRISNEEEHFICTTCAVLEALFTTNQIEDVRMLSAALRYYSPSRCYSWRETNACLKNNQYVTGSRQRTSFLERGAASLATAPVIRSCDRRGLTSSI